MPRRDLIGKKACEGLAMEVEHERERGALQKAAARVSCCFCLTAF